MRVPATTIDTTRCVLHPLRVEDAAEMTTVLSDPALYEFIGGAPPSRDELERRYAAMVVGQSQDGTQIWLNWIVRLRTDAAPAVGTVQATVGDRGRQAEVAWVIDPRHQGRGYGGEAAAAMVDALIRAGVALVIAHIHPAHAASAAVARACGLGPTTRRHHGERRWETVDVQPSVDRGSAAG